MNPINLVRVPKIDNPSTNLGFTLLSIDIPIFDGKYADWVSFNELFMQLLCSNRQISDTQKMVLLRNKVKGSAATAIANLHVT